MKKTFSYIILSLLIAYSFPTFSSSTQIIETSTLEDITLYADKNSLVIFDIDDTLLINSFTNGKGLQFIPSKLSDESRKFIFIIIQNFIRNENFFVVFRLYNFITYNSYF